MVAEPWWWLLLLGALVASVAMTMKRKTLRMTLIGESLDKSKDDECCGMKEESCWSREKEAEVCSSMNDDNDKMTTARLQEKMSKLEFARKMMAGVLIECKQMLDKKDQEIQELQKQIDKMEQLDKKLKGAHEAKDSEIEKLQKETELQMTSQEKDDSGRTRWTRKEKGADTRWSDEAPTQSVEPIGIVKGRRWRKKEKDDSGRTRWTKKEKDHRKISHAKETPGAEGRAGRGRRDRLHLHDGWI